MQGGETADSSPRRIAFQRQLEFRGKRIVLAHCETDNPGHKKNLHKLLKYLDTQSVIQAKAIRLRRKVNPTNYILMPKIQGEVKERGARKMFVNVKDLPALTYILKDAPSNLRANPLNSESNEEPVRRVTCLHLSRLNPRRACPFPLRSA
jgi:hypothetical protein